MKYIPWTLAFAMICGVGCASQALAESVTLPGADIPGMDGKANIYVFPSQADNMTNCQQQHSCLSGATSPDAASIQIAHNDKGQLQTVTVHSADALPSRQDSPFISSDYTASSSEMERSDYFVRGGGTNSAGAGKTGGPAPGNDIYQVLDSPECAADDGSANTAAGAFFGGSNKDGRTAGPANGITARHFARAGATALFGDVGAMKMQASLNVGLMTYNFSTGSGPISPGGAPSWAKDNADDMALVAGANDANNTDDEVKKPETSTVLLFGMGTIATIVLFGMGIAGLAGRKK